MHKSINLHFRFWHRTRVMTLHYCDTNSTVQLLYSSCQYTLPTILIFIVVRYTTLGGQGHTVVCTALKNTLHDPALFITHEPSVQYLALASASFLLWIFPRHTCRNNVGSLKRPFEGYIFIPGNWRALYQEGERGDWPFCFPDSLSQIL